MGQPHHPPRQSKMVRVPLRHMRRRGGDDFPTFPTGQGCRLDAPTGTATGCRRLIVGDRVGAGTGTAAGSSRPRGRTAGEMKRAAIYARFSSERQNERSCRDQTDLCAAWAERQGYIVVASYDDQAISGASTINRLGLGRLMRDARDRAFDVVICEALDRLSRDQADLATIKKQLTFLDIGISTVQDGEVGAMHIGLKGLMGEMFLADLAQKTRRGLRARVNAGASGGGRSYGYEAVEGKPGELRVIEREAAVVRRIFAEYAAGRTPRQIVADLNRDGIPGPRGGNWNASTVNGSRERRNGIIQNRLYAGEI